MSEPEAKPRAELIRIRGKVQGVGFRPFVARLAQSLQIQGRVGNDHQGVFIYLEGLPERLDLFRQQIQSTLPDPARVEELRSESATLVGYNTFEISESEHAEHLSVRVPADRATCADCRAEVSNPADRRYRYPLTTCDSCGPRYSMIRAMPYDRVRTSMGLFPLCPTCGAEYRSPSNRRFHAQPIACSACGPRVVLEDANGKPLALDDRAIDSAAEALRLGRVVGLKGVGGFQLLVRADSDPAVAELRKRKSRPSKPLAVMVRSVAAASLLGTVGPFEAKLLESPENPIVLLERRDDPPRLSPLVAPRVSMVGVMLPTTPLHLLLLDRLEFPVVATSGNQGDEPIILGELEDSDRLAPLAALRLTHDRPIVRRVDDSLTRVIDGRQVLLRCARGYAPLPLPAIEQLTDASGRAVPPLLALGGHQKVAIALWNTSQAVLSEHIGDLDRPATRDAFEGVVQQLTALYHCQPETIACDLHPDYFSTRWAQVQGLPLIQVQHHHAHAVSGMVEHGLLNTEVLALTWDGTGFGEDGTIWGGEILRSRASTYERIASLRTFPLPGGEQAIRHPGRIALGILAQTMGEESLLKNQELLARLGLTTHQAELLLLMTRRGLNSPWTSSLGRLFDAVASIIGLGNEVSHEGEAAVWLESASDPDSTEVYPIPADDSGLDPLSPGQKDLSRFDWRPMIAEILVDLSHAVSIRIIAAKFQNTIAAWGGSIVGQQTLNEVVLGGGCFQNRRLTERTLDAIRSTGAKAHGPGLIPPGDGGLAVGQLAVALSRLSPPERGI